MSDINLSKIGFLLGKPDNNIPSFKIAPLKPQKEFHVSDLLLTPDKLSNSVNTPHKPAISNFNFFGGDLASPELMKTGNSAGVSTSTGNNSGKLINENSRVLHIGDSHTVGHYGDEMDKIMRKTGAKVFTLGSSGSAPSSWIDGYTTKSGFAYKDEAGNKKVPASWRIITPETERKLKSGEMKEWQIPTRTPAVKEIISQFKPNVIVFSLGANLLGYAQNIVRAEKKLETETNPTKRKELENSIISNGKAIENQVTRISEIAKESGAKIVWVGPPDGRPDKKPEEVQRKLYEHLEKAALQYGPFIDSRPHTDYPAGAPGDGVHFWGKQEGMSRAWANTVLKEINK